MYSLRDRPVLAGLLAKWQFNAAQNTDVNHASHSLLLGDFRLLIYAQFFSLRAFMSLAQLYPHPIRPVTRVVKFSSNRSPQTLDARLTGKTSFRTLKFCNQTFIFMNLRCTWHNVISSPRRKQCYSKELQPMAMACSV
jgi:hypothetical protein